MIDALQNDIELDKILRLMILKQTGLKSDRVLNAMSIRGIDLVKRFGYLQTSIDVKDCFIVFEISNRVEDYDVSMVEADDSITSYQSYRCSLTIYGNNAVELAVLLKARFETDKCRSDLFDQAICFERISDMTETNEFLNETAWHRVDMNIDFSVRFNFAQVDDFEDFESADISVPVE